MKVDTRPELRSFARSRSSAQDDALREEACTIIGAVQMDIKKVASPTIGPASIHIRVSGLRDRNVKIRMQLILRDLHRVVDVNLKTWPRPDALATAGQPLANVPSPSLIQLGVGADVGVDGVLPTG